MKPLCVDLFCGLGGWTEGFLAEGYDVIGYDIEAHDYGTGGYPGTLILRDVRSIHGSELRDAAVIVASPPCQAYSYRAMPWKKAKALPPPDNTLFNECWRIQREAIKAAGHYIPLIVENVRGAQKWVGRARANYGSFYLWGDVGMVGRRVVAIVDGKPHGRGVAPYPKEAGKTPPGNSAGKPMWKDRPMNSLSHATLTDENREWYGLGRKVPGFRFDGSGKSFQTASVAGVKGFVPVGTKATGKHGQPRILPQIVNKKGSGSNARKMASAMIAKIPLPLSQYIARSFKPNTDFRMIHGEPVHLPANAVMGAEFLGEQQ